MSISVVVSDFGGVLTNPLWEGFQHVNAQLGVPVGTLNEAMTELEAASGVHPLYALERGEMTEADFLAGLDAIATEKLGRPARIHEFSDHYWSALKANPPVIDELFAMKARGYRLALLTNNVREWEPRWRVMFPVDELFEVVVDSAFVGMRKPEAGIYELTVSRLGVAGPDCVLLDDFEHNCEGARACGWSAVRFETTEQALTDLRALLAESGAFG